MPRLPASTAWRIWTRLLTLPARTPALSQMRLRPTRRISRLRMRTLGLRTLTARRSMRTLRPGRTTCRRTLKTVLMTQAWRRRTMRTPGTRATTMATRRAMIPPCSRGRTRIRTRTLTRATLRMATSRATWRETKTRMLMPQMMTLTTRTRHSSSRRAMRTTPQTTTARRMTPVMRMPRLWPTTRTKILMMMSLSCKVMTRTSGMMTRTLRVRTILMVRTMAPWRMMWTLMTLTPMTQMMMLFSRKVMGPTTTWRVTRTPMIPR
mmetsp:Transcript_33106/g.72334  ORF Transcript_33106/g.72334 Transcript_33106/m.72334 type:complete len:264 (-) Transcript_33106:251-1042(-)